MTGQPPERPSANLTYAATGIDLTAREGFVERIARLTAAQGNPNILAGIGPFASLFRLAGYRDPVVAASVDSVGTKLRLAIITERYRGVGFDIVNHCVNDVLTSGARPIFFLDYIGSSELPEAAKYELVEGMVEACAAAGCVLIGGETADMPDIYAAGDFDLVGFMIGAAERSEVIDPRAVSAGDVLVGLPAEGLHTNGYTLVRRVFDIGSGGDILKDREVLERYYDELRETLGDALLRPHASYLAQVEAARPALKAIAHITGGGIAGNLGRVIPEGLQARVECGSWASPRIFHLIAEVGEIASDEMYRVFNMGLGMVFVVAAGDVAHVRTEIPEAIVVGQVRRGEPRVVLDEAP